MNTVTLGERDLQIISNGPVKHDIWMMEQVRAAGIDQVTVPKDMSVEVFRDTLLDRVMTSGKALVFLGGMLAPAELDIRQWTVAVADEMIDYIGRLVEPEDKLVVRGLIATVLIAFFRSGIVSLQTSPTSSTLPPGNDGQDEEDDPTPALGQTEDV